MTTVENQNLNSPIIEKIILSTIAQHGEQAYLDCADVINESSFEDFNNKIIFSACQNIFENNEKFNIVNICVNIKNDIPNIDIDKISATLSYSADIGNIRKYANLLKNKSIIKELILTHRKNIDKLSLMNGAEKLQEILSTAESSIFDAINKYSNSEDSNSIHIGSIANEIVTEWMNDPSEVIGLPTPWIEVNKSIGGGMRVGVHLIGSRSGQGKSTIGLITGAFLAECEIPVLFLDSEMEEQTILPRILANMSGVKIKDIESGLFGQNELDKQQVFGSVKKLESIPFYYRSIAGLPFTEIISIIRRWIYTSVGINSKGKANQCLVIYDYFKLMDSGDIDNMQEHQALGFQISKLTDFCKKYSFPCLSFVQLNRDGIGKESTDVIAQSDRLLWLCNSFSIFKLKSIEEVMRDGVNKGNRKFITLKSRYGGEHEFGKYIGMSLKPDIASLLEVGVCGSNNEEQ